jgi:hypothetical protein
MAMDGQIWPSPRAVLVDTASLLVVLRSFVRGGGVVSAIQSLRRVGLVGSTALPFISLLLFCPVCCIYLVGFSCPNGIWLICCACYLLP